MRKQRCLTGTSGARISRCAPACVYAFHSATPGKPRSMITSIPAALPAIAIASSGSPARNPPTLASIDECVPVSVSVTTLAWGNPAGWPLASTGPPNAARFSRRVRHVEHEPVHRGHPHPPPERAVQAGRGHRPGQPAEHRLDHPRTQPLPGPGERGLVRNRLVHPLQRSHQVLRNIVIGVLLEQGKSEHVVDHEPGRKRPGPLVPPAALSQDLIHQPGGHPLGEHTQPHVIS